MVSLFLVKPYINIGEYYHFRESMKKVFKTGFSSLYNKKVPPNKYLISNYGKLLFGEHTIWPGLVNVIIKNSNYFLIRYDDNLAVLKDLEIEVEEIESLIATVVGHMEISSKLEIIKDYREQD